MASQGLDQDTLDMLLDTLQRFTDRQMPPEKLLELDAKKPGLAREHLAAAEALIRETGYHRRDAELAQLQQAAEAEAP